jgi:hypothetical protein
MATKKLSSPPLKAKSLRSKPIVKGKKVLPTSEEKTQIHTLKNPPRLRGKRYNKPDKISNVTIGSYKVKIQKIRNDKYYVAKNEKGQIVASRPIKDSGMNYKQAKARFKQTRGSFYEDHTQQRFSWNDTTEVTHLAPKGTKILQPRAKYVQYACSGDYMGQHIVARSSFIGTKNVTNGKVARDDARDNFFMRLSYLAFKDSDHNEKDILEKGKLTNYREGWVSYIRRNE